VPAHYADLGAFDRIRRIVSDVDGKIVIGIGLNRKAVELAVAADRDDRRARHDIVVGPCPADLKLSAVVPRIVSL
jgi:hypothetical protein